MRIVVIEYLDLASRVGQSDVVDLEVDPRLLRQAADDVSALQDSVRNVLNELRFNLASRGTSWQRGAFGTAFASEYLDAEQLLLESTQNLAATLGRYASAMSDAAGELAAADSMPRVGGR